MIDEGDLHRISTIKIVRIWLSHNDIDPAHKRVIL